MTRIDRHYLFGQYDAEQPHTHRYLSQPVLSHLARLPAGSDVLDAGCGNGAFAKVLADNGFKVCGLDLAESGIAEARKLVPEARFLIASLYEDFQAAFNVQFDAVVALEVIEHLYDPRTFVERVYDCLRPGGLFVLSTPYHGYWKNLLLSVLGKWDFHFTALWDGGHIKFWSRKTVSQLLEEKGFRMTAFQGVGRLPYLWKSMIVVASRP